MEVENKSSMHTKDEDDDSLPGFRFHPTDEELVGFYLRRKVEKKPIRFELIKQADIYKYDPWDLPKSSKGGEKEWYFFCRRGRKYKNSIRPNRVTTSGFWKATGIDRPIYSPSRECIGLKKSLVYYRGSAGKGTKTEWMMHEFRLPPTHTNNPTIQEAEVWTLCRILKRNVSYRKSPMCVAADWREVSNKRDKIMNINPSILFDARSSVEPCDNDHDKINGGQKSYICFSSSAQSDENRVGDISNNVGNIIDHRENDVINQGYFSSSSSVISQAAPSSTALSSYMSGDINEFLRHADWEDLRSVMDYADTNNPCLYI